MIAIENELATLRTRIERLEALININGVKDSKAQQPTAVKRDREALLDWLKSQNRVATLPADAQSRIHEWRSLADTEKEKHIQEMRSLQLEPKPSEIIIESRQ